MDKKELYHHLRYTPLVHLKEQADKVRRSSCGDAVYIRSLFEFSNQCVRNCKYCGLRRENQDLTRFRIGIEDIIELARVIYKKGIKTMVLQSGDDFYYTRDMIVRMIHGIKKQCRNIAITLSIGERPFDDYIRFKDAGVDRYLIKHETFNERLYNTLHPGQSGKKRIQILEFLKKKGFQVGTGFMVGLPGQTLKHLAEDIHFVQEFQPDMIGIGPFLPQKNTPLGDQDKGDFERTLKCLSLTRIVTKNAHMPATTALGSLRPQEGLYEGLMAGCNVIMCDLTPAKYRRLYTLYDNKKRITLDIARIAIRQAHRHLSCERGDSLKQN